MDDGKLFYVCIIGVEWKFFVYGLICSGIGNYLFFLCFFGVGDFEILVCFMVLNFDSSVVMFVFGDSYFGFEGC